MQGYPNLNINGTNTNVNRQAFLIQKAITETEQNKYKLIPYVHSFLATPFTLILTVQLLKYGEDMNSQLLAEVPYLTRISKR